jgi:pyruvate/2-oxoglutarate/acetoin dehydrogenase E1 component
VRCTGAAASVVRPGNDLTLVTNQLARREAEAAAGDDVQPVGGDCEQQPA